MKKQLLLGLAATTAIGAGAFALGEEEASNPQMFCIYKEVVAPSKTKEYEAAIKHMISEFKAYNIDPQKVHFEAIVGPEIGYIYVMHIENFAGMDTMRENFMAAVQTIGEENWQDIEARAAAAMEHVDVFHSVHRADLSYGPENPRLKPEEIEYIQYGFYYVTPGKGHEFEELAKKFRELYKSNGIDSGWSIYQVITGADLPLYVVAHAARNESDFYTTRDEIRALLGEEAKALGVRVDGVVRKIERKGGRPRPDLSYPGPDMAAAPSKN